MEDSLRRRGNLTANDIVLIYMHQRAGQTMTIHVHGRNYLTGNQRINLPFAGPTELELWIK